MGVGVSGGRAPEFGSRGTESWAPRGAEADEGQRWMEEEDLSEGR